VIVPDELSRRRFLQVGLVGARTTTRMLTRKIPRTGEELPVIGLGTWQTFDVGDGAERAPLSSVLRTFFAAGGRLIDSSPMYGRAESVVGDLLAASPPPVSPGVIPFLATKVWTSGRTRGEEQMRTSLERMRTKKMDLMQIHNLVDWRTQLATLRAWKAAGKIRYLGVTHYQPDAFDELEAIIKKEKVDFVQLPYSIAVRKAEERLLPAAAENQTAVIVMRPFEGGSLLRDVRGKPLPPWAAEIDCTSWAQVFLKFILGHPAVTCPIPATSKPEHIADNVLAGVGRMPDEPLRRKMLQHLGL
jgi:diketogulonate reductase-like aldo/keto reductase